MNCMINLTKEMSVHHLHLTSNPNRIVANEMYMRMGFDKYTTNCYRMNMAEVANDKVTENKNNNPCL